MSLPEATDRSWQAYHTSHQLGATREETADIHRSAIESDRAADDIGDDLCLIGARGADGAPANRARHRHPHESASFRMFHGSIAFLTACG